MIRAGALDQRITIETPATVEDELGQDALAWLFLAKVWARAVEQQGREFLKGDFVAEEKVAFQIRWREVDSTMRVSWRGRVWRIVSVTGTRREGEAWLHCISEGGPN